ncbi:hypothetical protein RhiirA4_472504 [Rhizophagus irregularis]|uniref:Uncharacterized protein n=1 Tax=Rhizophagus irregularis TaxID=588596 RepID=A0A2I1H512_9GLOM|nr:hypothetical protein RhiirA4_472504 [Rhizophagus irregularis]
MFSNQRAKIRSFYASNIYNNELAYVSQQYIEDELYEMINDLMLLQFEEEDDEINNETQSKKMTVSDIPNHIVQFTKRNLNAPIGEGSWVKGKDKGKGKGRRNEKKMKILSFLNFNNTKFTTLCSITSASTSAKSKIIHHKKRNKNKNENEMKT